MTNQLVLIDIVPAERAGSEAGWELDPATCEIGRRGVARARKALRDARTPDRGATVASPDLPAAA